MFRTDTGRWVRKRKKEVDHKGLERTSILSRLVNDFYVTEPGVQTGRLSLRDPVPGPLEVQIVWGPLGKLVRSNVL